MLTASQGVCLDEATMAFREDLALEDNPDASRDQLARAIPRFCLVLLK